MKGARTDGSAASGINIAVEGDRTVEGDCGIAQGPLGIYRGHEASGETALLPKRGFDLVATKTRAHPASDDYIDHVVKGTRHGAESENTPETIL